MKRTHRKIIFIVFWFLSLGGIFIISAVFFLIWNDTKNPYKNTIEF